MAWGRETGWGGERWHGRETGWEERDGVGKRYWMGRRETPREELVEAISYCVH